MILEQVVLPSNLHFRAPWLEIALTAHHSTGLVIRSLRNSALPQIQLRCTDRLLKVGSLRSLRWHHAIVHVLASLVGLKNLKIVHFEEK